MPPVATSPLADDSTAMRWSQSDDVVAHAANLSGWQQQYDQLSGGAFRGQLAEVWFDEVQVFRERTSHAVRQTCRIRPDTVWCGITMAPDGSRIEGHRVGDSGVMVNGSGDEFELLTPNHHDILGIVASRSALRAAAQAQGQALNDQMLSQPTWLACNPVAHAQLRRGLALLLGQAGNGESCHDHGAARRFAQAAVLDTLLSVLSAPRSDGRECLSFERRKRLVQRACEQTTSHSQALPTVPDLCEHLHVSHRTLQYAFETVVGASPVAYLRTLRLNAVRRDLLTGTMQTVQEAAGQHGFWSLSQFSSDYRRQFAERPSQTLARARPGRAGEQPLSPSTPMLAATLQ
ncbi:MAG: helix-turn-helix domain-containing protein [Pseudomonadota bacterium]|nr:helix-turn-helix domain-containing protein [Pseudomonadota bacterium]